MAKKKSKGLKKKSKSSKKSSKNTVSTSSKATVSTSSKGTVSTSSKGTKADSSEQQSFGSIFMYGNMRLFFPLLTFIFFNYLKFYHIEGYTLQFFSFFHLFMIMSYVYYINFNSICNKSDSNSFMRSSRYALILLFLINIFMNINPYKESMTFVKSNILFTMLLVIFFNIINLICNFNKQNLCKSDEKMMYILILIILHLIESKINLSSMFVSKLKNR